MALMWTEFGMIVHYRKRFFKRRRQALINAATAAGGGPFPSMPQPPPPMYPPAQLQQQQGEMPDYLTNTKLERHTKWLLALIIISMVFCLLEFGLSLGDGAFGGFSLWMAPVGALLTETLHVVTLPVWKHTAKKRKGMPKPSFIYSVTLCVLTCLLAVYWLAVSILTFCLSGSYYAYSYSSSSSYYYPYDDVVVPWIEATFALLLSALMWAQFGIIVHFRHRFLRRVKRAKQAGQLPGTILVAPAYPMPYGAAQYNPALFQQQQPPLPYQAQYQQQPYHQPPPLPAYQSFQTYPPPTGAPSVVNPTTVEKMGDSK
ncbi:hypothetical protein FRC17_009898 [Serendipita sp. 399]|nr:hypothetical protein FRC17_009898 [Serendipita sp. 399]